MPDTNTVDVGDSFEHWHQVTCRNYSISEFQRDSDDPFPARLASRAFGALAVTEASTFSVGATRLVRGAADIRRDPRDHFMLYLVTDGEMGVVQAGREARAQTGDLFLYDQAVPFSLEFPRSHDAIMLNIPRPLLESRVAPGQSLMARRIAGDTQLGALAGSIIRQLAGFDATSRATTDRVAAATLDIVAAALDADSVAPPARRHRLRNQVEHYLLAHLEDARLNIDTIAAALNMAPRTLNRVFADQATTPMRWLWQQRLAASHRALLDGRCKTVTDAALTFGFSDLSHFSRAFKAAFGTSPQALKRG